MPTALTVGNFDGVHAGHAALVRAARDAAGPEGPVVVLSFEPHPIGRLRPGSEPQRLGTFERRAELLRELGADEVVPLEPTAELLARTPGSFVEHIAERFSPDWMVEGEDFRFGKGRAGDVETLEKLGRAHGFGVNVVGAVHVELTDQTLVRASSTVARWLIGHGRMQDAARVLGRRYAMEGTVVRGERRGRTIGYPTCNLDAECMAPGDGVYRGMAALPDGRRVPAAISVGTKLTFHDPDAEPERAVEAYLVDVENDGDAIAGLPEYGWPIRLEFASWLRSQERYGTLDGLLEQMARDVNRTREGAAAENQDTPRVPQTGVQG